MRNFARSLTGRVSRRAAVCGVQRGRGAGFGSFGLQLRHGAKSHPPRPDAQQQLEQLSEQDPASSSRAVCGIRPCPRDVRLAGALILLFGTTTARPVRLYTDTILGRPR